MLGGRRWRRMLLRALGVLALAVVVLNWTWGRLPSEPQPRGSFANVAGLRMHYIERPGRGIPVLLIHGLPGTAEDWNAVTALMPGRRTIAVDRPGFGYSSGGYVPFDRQLSTLAALMSRLGIARAVIAGHSYGGTLAIGFAERYPSRVAGLALVDAAGGGLKIDFSNEVQAHLVQVLQAPVIRQVANATFGQLALTFTARSGDDRAFSPQPVDPAHRHRLLAINMTHGNLEAFAGEQLAATGVIEKIDAGIGAIHTPSIVLQGDRDKLVDPRFGRRIAATLPGAQLRMLHGGHMQPYTHPFAVAAAISQLAHQAEAPVRAKPPKTKS